ncbi:hypothetical protein JHW43_003405 [Diplocarpon mali]|nr:hypothetical protein JHW43_003405 [Diplocarpon mali]
MRAYHISPPTVRTVHPHPEHRITCRAATEAEAAPDDSRASCKIRQSTLLSELHCFTLAAWRMSFCLVTMPKVCVVCLASVSRAPVRGPSRDRGLISIRLGPNLRRPWSCTRMNGPDPIPRCPPCRIRSRIRRRAHHNTARDLVTWHACFVPPLSDPDHATPARPREHMHDDALPGTALAGPGTWLRGLLTSHRSLPNLESRHRWRSRLPDRQEREDRRGGQNLKRPTDVGDPISSASCHVNTTRDTAPRLQFTLA